MSSPPTSGYTVSGIDTSSLELKLSSLSSSGLLHPTNRKVIAVRSRVLLRIGVALFFIFLIVLYYDGEDCFLAVCPDFEIVAIPCTGGIDHLALTIAHQIP